MVQIVPKILAAILLARFATAQPHGKQLQQGINLSGKAVDPLQLSTGKAAVLMFVRNDYPISNRYAPAIQRMSARFSWRATFWLVYPDKDATPKIIRRHLQDYKYKLGVLRDPQHVWVRRAKVAVTPEAAVFDSTGKPVYHGRIDDLYQAFGKARSAATTHELADAIEAALRGETPKVTSTEAVGCYISDLE